MRISIGKSRKDTHWKTVEVSWEKLCKRLSKTHISSETMAEYKAMNKTEKAEKKDIGGFVGGVVEGGRRTKASVKIRTLITLDADYALKGFADNVSVLYDYAMCIYSTHSSTPNAPRLRILLPLSREVTAEEYEPIARSVANELGIEQFDVTTYETNRLMYFPSTPRDGQYIFKVVDGEPVDADAVLARYHDWHDVREWATSSAEGSVREKRMSAQGDPTGKPGLVGLFCRTYDVPSAIEKFLSDKYEPCEAPDRYTYTDGSSTAGVVIYQDGQFAYSHHATDPANGMLCNAFDLVRVHKFGSLDYEVDSETPVNRLPSYKAMCELVSNDDECRKAKVEEQMETAKAVFSESVEEEVTEADLDWAKRLSLTRSGAVEETTDNILLILDHDSKLAGCLAQNEFNDRACLMRDTPWRKCRDKRNGEPWTDSDEACLRNYLESVYGIYNKGKTSDAVDACLQKHAFHPVRDWLEQLVWDGEPRGEHLFIDALGAEDDLYTRTVTRKWLMAAVARVYRPGTKFDNMVVLVGDQGIGKSYLGNKLGHGWFSDTFVTVSGKEAFEQLKGVWIVEMGELSVMKRAEVESVKLFISKQEDFYRAAYGRFAKSNPRQCVFYGTTNDDDFLTDSTGNRRFLPIKCGETDSHTVFDITDEYIAQVWAEAVTWYKTGESLFLDEEVSAMARERQAKYSAENPEIGRVEEFLDTPIPTNWEELSKSERRNYMQGYSEGLTPSNDTVPREEISIAELAYELDGKIGLKPWEYKPYGILLRQAGWEKGVQKRTAYGSQRMYTRRKK